MSDKNIKNNETKRTVIVLVFVILLLSSLFYPFDIAENFSHYRFNFRIANYHFTKRCLLFTDYISLLTKKTSKLSYIFRNSLLKQYLKINNNAPKNLYNSIGIFYDLHRDFQILYFINEKNNHSDVQKYNDYKDKYIFELKKVLSEYSKRDNSINNFLDIKAYGDFAYKIPNRITLFPELANSYFLYTDFSANDVDFLKNTLFSFDIILNQEKMKNSDQYRTKDRGIYKQQFDENYKIFLYKYSKEIIKLENEILPAQICSQKNITDIYLKSLIENNIKIDNEIEKIIHLCN